MSAVAALRPKCPWRSHRWSSMASKISRDELRRPLGKVPFEIYEHHSPFLFRNVAAAHEARSFFVKSVAASPSQWERALSRLFSRAPVQLRGHLAKQLDGPYVITEVCTSVIPTDKSGRRSASISTGSSAPPRRWRTLPNGFAASAYK